MSKTLYPPNWKELAKLCKERAGWRCEKCGIAHRTWRMGRNGDSYKVRIAAAHLDQDPSNPEPRLQALCNTCHLEHDSTQHTKNARKTYYRRQHEIEIEAGQLELFAEDDEEKPDGLSEV